jgi:hypothetical protein
MINFKLSNHSIIRSQQRAVSDSLTQVVFRYGSTTVARGPGANYYYFSRESIANMTRDGVCRKLIDEARKKMGYRWVVSADDQTLLTVTYTTKRNRRIH